MSASVFAAANGGRGRGSHQRQSVDLISTEQHRQSGGAMPMPVTSPRRPFPPKTNKNSTQHVPCKFFPQGQCQAGRTCPFSHDVESSARPAPCKYFAKGGCKFGRKCALLHITPDGTVVNRGPQFAPGGALSGAHGQLGGFGQPPTPGLLSMQAHSLEPRPNGEVPFGMENLQYGARNGHEIRQIDVTHVPPSPQYGSPVRDSRFATSPSNKGLSVLDVPLPNSFDSNGISMAARNGPFAASVPSRFGVESPPSSLPRRSQLGNTALRDLHKSAFGGRGMDGMLAGSSPPGGSDEPLTFPKRSLYAETLHAPGNQMISSSLCTKLPTQSFDYSDDDDEETHPDREEDLLPASLRDLIPDGRTRRESRSRAEDENTPASFLAAQRRTITTQGTPSESKAGSPLVSSPSPSRYTSIWGRQRNEGESNYLIVGSPLRNSGFGFSLTTTSPNGDRSPTVSSPPRQASMSMLTQELQRTKLDAARSQAQAAVGMTRNMSAGSQGRSSLDRSTGTNGATSERTGEEQALFDMDEVGDGTRAPGAKTVGSNRSSGTWSSKALSSSLPENGPRVLK